MKIVIESGIPVPGNKAGRHGNGALWNALLTRMQIGDSVVLPEREAYNFSNYMRKHGIKPAMRSLANSHTLYRHRKARVWYVGSRRVDSRSRVVDADIGDMFEGSKPSDLPELERRI